jgi:hypothetical protein
MVQKELKKISQWFWNGFLKWCDGGEENGITSKRIFEVEVFFPSQNIGFPFYLSRLLELFFLFLLYFFFLCSISWGLGGFDDIWGEKHFFKNLFSNGMTWNGMVITMNILAVDAYSGMELRMPILLNHDYRDVEVVDISAVDAYSGVELCTPIFLGEASK